MSKFLRLAFFIGIVLSGCIPHKKTVYFQDKEAGPVAISDSIASLKKDNYYTVQPGDLLFISITSLNKEITEFYNLQTGEKTSYLSFYLVDDSGNVTIPMLGKIEIKNLSIEQTQNKILKKVQETVTDATVIVKLGSFKVTVLGDVKAPGVKAIEGEKGTIFDAIAIAGDINETGDRRQVKIIRELNNDMKDIIVLDLTDKRVINSSHIYLRPNDVVYVQPLKAKATRDNISQFGRFAFVGTMGYLVIRILNLIP